MTGYAARQSVYTSGDTVEAADTNDELNALLSAFNSTTGHTHGGAAGEGAPLVATTLTGGTQYGVLLLHGTGVASTSTAAFTGGQVLIGQSAAEPGPKTISGDATLSASGALTLASTAVTPASYGSATASPTYTVDAKGRLTAAADVTVTPAFSSITGTPTTLAGYGITDAQSLDATLTSLALLGTAADKFAYTTGIDTWAEADITAAGLAILDDANASAQRVTLGLVIGTDVQAYDATILVDADIGVNVQAYDATIVVDADIGSTVQAYQAAQSQATWEAGVGTTESVVSPAKISAAITALGHAGGGLPTGFVNGLVTSNDAGDTTNDINVTAGSCRDSADVEDMALASEITKQIDATWSAGDDAGGLSSSLTATNDTWYHVFAIVVGGSADVGFDTSITAANLVTDHSATAYRRIGSVLYGTATIDQFIQDGDRFLWVTPVQDYAASGSTSGALLTVSAPPDVVTYAEMIVVLSDASGAHVWVRNPDQVNSVPASGNNDARAPASAALQSYNKTIPTNTSAQVRHRVSAAATNLSIVCNGWTDRRGA